MFVLQTAIPLVFEVVYLSLTEVYRRKNCHKSDRLRCCSVRLRGILYSAPVGYALPVPGLNKAEPQTITWDAS